MTNPLESISAEQARPLLAMAIEMRDEQRKFFGATDSRAKTVALQRARALEREFDRLTKDYRQVGVNP